ncbi:MAG: SpoIIE family protein phosphatase [Flammeovirgaceae bacterium]
MRSIVIFYFLLLITITSSLAQELGKPFIKNFPPSAYNGHTQNWSLVQRDNELIYVGNNFGVLEYDGHTWRLIPVSNQSVVRSLAKSADGKIYVGAQGDFGQLVQDSIGGTAYQSFVQYVPDSLKEKFTNVWEILASSNNEIIFITNDYLFIWSGDALSTLHLSSGFHRGYTLGDRVFIMTYEKGLMEYKNGALHELPISSFFKEKRIYALMPFADHRLLAATKTGFLSFNPDVDRAASSTFQQATINPEVIYHGIQLKNKNYAFTTLGDGVYVLNSEGLTLRHVTQELGLLDDVCINLLEDRTGGLWVGTNNGISYIELSSPISYFDKQLGIPSGVNTIMRYQGILYAGTDVGMYQLENNQFIPVQEMADQQIWDFLKFPVPNSQDTILVIASENGVYCYDGKELDQISQGVSFHLLLDDHDPTKLYIAAENRLAVGYFKRKGTREASFVLDPKLRYTAKSEIRKMAQGAAGSIWLGTSFSGINQVKVDDQSAEKSSYLIATYDSFPDLANLKDLYPYRIGNALIVASTKGLYEFNAQEKAFQRSMLGHGHLGATNALSDKTDIYRIAEKSTGELWMIGVESGSSPLAVFDRDNVPIQGPYKRLPAQSYEEIYHDEANTAVTWLGGASGIYRFDMRNRVQQLAIQQDFPSYVRKVVMVEDSLIFNGTVSQKIPKINHEYNILTFHYASPSFDGDEPNQYSVQLEGYDKKWSAWTRDAKQHYTNLPERKYTFKVKTKNAYGFESAVGSYSFTVLPPFYRTKVAYFSYVFAFGGLLWASARLYARKLRKEKEHLERLVKERTLVIEEQKNDILEKNVELGQQNEEIMAQRDLLDEQNKDIQKKNFQITSSINYAKRIQQAMLPSSQKLLQLFEDHFILFMPRDVVSGDFYWATQKNNQILIAAVDCTGHGVPGAFMSMIGDALLDQIVSDKGITQPDQVLDLLNKGVGKLLNQNVSANQDGMDMALCSIDTAKQELHFAGAKNDLVYLQNGELTFVKGSRLSIGGFKMKNRPEVYDLHTIAFDQPTTCYLFTDGYIDQMGGPEGRKFMIKRLKDLLLSIHHLPMAEQQQLLQTNIKQWMQEGGEKQIDDILVIGFKIG